MSADFEAVLRERFAIQDDSRARADLGDVRRRARRYHTEPRSRARRKQRFLSRRIVLAVAAAALAVGAAGAGVALTAGSPPPVTDGFSALDDRTLPPAPETVDPSLLPPYRSVMDMFRGLGPGPYETRRVGEGMYLGRRGDILCGVVVHGGSQCTDQLRGDVWLQGDQFRSYNAETAPFEVHFYGFARDPVASIRVTTANGTVTDVPVVHNAFQTTLENTTFDEITGLEVVYSSGKTDALDPKDYYRSQPAAR